MPLVLSFRRGILALAMLTTVTLAGCAVPGPLQGPFMATHLLPLHCVGRAQPAGAPPTPPQTKCFTTQAEALAGLIFAGTQQQVSRDMREQLPDLPPLVFDNANQPYCAAVLVDPHAMTVKAACFATLQQQMAATKNW
ncbi:MAG: hypothetical protein ACR2JY_14925 [Chloroflexota bacterium]